MQINTGKTALSLFVILAAGACRPLTEAPETKTAAPAQAPAPMEALMNPAKAVEQAPGVFQVRVNTTKGDFTLEGHRDWAPNGADRFYNLVKMGFFEDIAFFRAIDGFMVQFGIHGSPDIAAKWREVNIKDDKAAGQSNKPGMVSFATAGPDTRTTQLFINYADNGQLDGMGFTPFAKVVEGMDVVNSLYKGYGEGAPRGRGPDQGRIQMEGNAYLKKDYPELDYIKSAKLL